MSWVIKALVWAATNQASLALIVEGIGSLLGAYFTLRTKLIESGALTSTQAAAHDETLFQTLGHEAKTEREEYDALIERLKP